MHSRKTYVRAVPGRWHMRRRLVLANMSLALSTYVSGCVSENGGSDTGNESDTEAQEDAGGTETGDEDNSESSTESENTSGPARAEDIVIVLRNFDTTEKTVSLALSTPEETLLRGDFEVDPDAELPVNAQITEPGQYELTITVHEGPTTSTSFNIDDYDLQAGSNLIIEIDDGSLSVMLQE